MPTVAENHHVEGCPPTLFEHPPTVFERGGVVFFWLAGLVSFPRVVFLWCASKRFGLVWLLVAF